MNAEVITEKYFEFIKKNTQINPTKGLQTEIITPFVNSRGEGISFEVYSDGKFFTVTDNGYTVWDLSNFGIDLKKKGRRRELFESQLAYNGFSIEKDIISKKVTKNDLGQAIHDMTQMLINIGDLTYLHSNNVHQQFFEDVKNYFMKSDEFRVFPSFNITGRSKLNHKFNYVFMSKGIAKLTRVYNSIDKQKVDSILTSWLDTVEFRKLEYFDKEELFIILSNEGFENLNDDHLLALNSYDIKVLNFDNKESLVTELGA